MGKVIFWKIFWIFGWFNKDLFGDFIINKIMEFKLDIIKIFVKIIGIFFFVNSKLVIKLVSIFVLIFKRVVINGEIFVVMVVI